MKTKNIFSALTTDILNMFAKIAYQQTVMKPLNDWFTGIVGNWIGGGSNSSAALPPSGAMTGEVERHSVMPFQRGAPSSG